MVGYLSTSGWNLASRIESMLLRRRSIDMFKRLFRWLIRSALISFAIFLVIAVSRYIAHRYRPGSVIVLELDGPLQERANTQGFNLRQPRVGALNAIRAALHSARDDPRIVGLAIKIIDPEMDLAQAQELCGL